MARNRRSRKKKNMTEEEIIENNIDSTQNVEEQNAEESNITEENPTTELSKEEELAIQVKEGHEKYLRLYSDFDNFRKRSAKEKLDLISTAGSAILKSLLPVLDDFDRAFLNEDVADDPEVMKGGFGLIHKKLLTILEQKGLKVMEVKKGDSFDTDLHEAIAQIPAEEESLKGKVIDVIEKGYLINEKILRHAKVVIGN